MRRAREGGRRGGYPKAVTAALELALRPPFSLTLTAWALRRRPHNAIDRFEAGVYRRALPVPGGAVALAVTQRGADTEPRLDVELAGATIDDSVAASLRAALERMLGLAIDVSPFAVLAASDPILAPLAAHLRGLRPPRFPTVFEALVNAIACQQLSLTVGIHLLNRLALAYGRPVDGDGDGDLRAFPGPRELAVAAPEDLLALGFSRAKARTIVGIAAAVAADDLDLEALDGVDDREAIATLTALHGVGRWTAEYVLLRGLGRLRVFPGDDVGARNGLRRVLNISDPLDYAGVEGLVARWRPYAGFVYLHLLLDSLEQSGALQFNQS